MIRITKGHDVRKKEILDAAERLFGEKGYDETSIQAIIDHVGIAKGTFYHYFSSKSELLDALMERIVEEIRAVLDAIMERGELDALGRIVAASASFANMGKGRERLMEYIHEERNAHIHLKIEKKVIPLVAPYLERIIEEGNAEGSFNVRYPRETGIALLGISGAVFEGRHSHTMDKLADRQLIEAVFDIDERILGTRPGLLKEYYDELLRKLEVNQ